MKERGILFQAAMVRALLAGTKTQTRRALRPQPPAHTVAVGRWQDPPGYDAAYWAFVREGPVEPDHPFAGAEIHGEPWRCPYGKVGDQLWGRETLKPWTQDPELFAYAADDTRVQGDGYNYPVKPGRPYVPSIHLARCWSRIQLEVTAVRVEQVRAITEADALAEGIEAMRCPHCHLAGYGLPGWGHDQINPTAREAYRYLWDSINAATHPWESNPWVWVVEFKRI